MDGAIDVLLHWCLCFLHKGNNPRITVTMMVHMAKYLLSALRTWMLLFRDSTDDFEQVFTLWEWLQLFLYLNYLKSVLDRIETSQLIYNVNISTGFCIMKILALWLIVFSTKVSFTWLTAHNAWLILNRNVVRKDQLLLEILCWNCSKHLDKRAVFKENFVI